MSYIPATPEKLVECLAQDNDVAASAGQQGSTTKGNQQGSLHEPSPASTYGDTAAGDSVPATPLDVGPKDLTMSMRGSLNSLHLNSGTPSGNEAAQQMTMDVGHPIYGLARELDSAEQVRSFATDQKRADPTSIPRGPTSLNVNSATKGESAGQPMNAELPQSDFVVHGRDSKADDPFFSPVQQDLVIVHDEANDAPTQATEGVSNGDADDSPSEHQVEVTSSPRADRLGQEISADNAQAILPPSACVFVANLSSVRSDEQLEVSVTQAFQSFGKVYVKIRRDNRGMPYAFCQYETKANADTAVDHGKNKLIDGRRCRTERAKVNRHLYMSKLSGDSIEEREARAQLEHFGAIEAVWYPTKTDTVMYQLPKGIWIQFAYFQDCRDAQSAFRDDPVFRLEQPPMPLDLRSRPLRSSASNSPFMRPSPSRTGCTPQHPMARKDTDSCCVFVGDLSPNVTQKQLGDLFGNYGRVLSMDLVSKPSANGFEATVFAFVEFAIPDEAALAVEAMDQQVFHGNRIRVERKEPVESATRRPYSLAHRGPANYASGSPNNRRNVQANISPSFDRTAAYQRLYDQAMQYGTPQVNAADILAAGRRQTSVADSSPTASQQAPMYPFLMPYPYYNPLCAQNTTSTPSNQLANYNLAPVDDDSVPGLSPSGPTFSQGGFSHGGYYPQVQSHAQPVTTGGPQSQTAHGAGVHQMTQQQYLNQQPMGQFQYPQGNLAYAQYPSNYYHYPTSQNGSGAPGLQYVYQHSEDPSQSYGSSGSTTIQGGEIPESR
ncbi:MAG: hypothetical protein M1836_007841 [Candelina mexicana]|nr:MAG: hypothetical protein M1836_007841 [Candelina mexicana]